MQRQQQKAPQFKPVISTDFAFQSFEKATTKMKNASGPFSRNNAPETQRNTQMMQQQQQEQHTQDQALGTDRLTSLHAKLHHEADKIRKWKVQTEMELKQKEKKLCEANMTVESLRKSILELQLENENLSTKLQDELGSREEIFQRIQNTRDLISLLKSQEDKFEQALSRCETERTELKYLEKGHAQQFEEISAKFKKLEIDASEQHSNLTKQVNIEREQRQAVEKQMHENMQEAEKKIKTLAAQIDEKDIALRDVHVILQKSEEKTHATDKTLGEVQQRVSHMSEELATRERQMEKIKAECATLQSECERLTGELEEERERLEQAKRQEDSIQEALNNSVAIFNQRQDTMQKEAEILRIELADEQRRLKETRAQLTESLTFTESLKSSRDVLLLEKTEMEFCLEKLKTELTDLQTEKYKNKAEIVSLETEVESLQLSLDQEHQESSKLQSRVDEANSHYTALEKEKTHLQQEMKRLKESLEAQKAELEQAYKMQTRGSNQNLEMQQTIGKLEKQLQDKSIFIEQMQMEVKEQEGKLYEKENLIASAENKLGQMQNDFQSQSDRHQKACAYISDLETQLSTSRQEKESLEHKLADLKEKNKKMQREREESGDKMASEIHTYEEKEGQMQGQIKVLKEDVKSKNKHVKELEKELKALHTKITQEEKKKEEHERQLEYLQQEVACNEKAKDDCDTLIASLQDQLEQERNTVKTCEQKVEEMKDETAKAHKEKAEAVLQCERQVFEMTATLEKYTQDHHRLLAQKDKEIEELHARTTELATYKQQSDRSAFDKDKAADKLQQKLKALTSKMENLEKRFKDKETEVQSLTTKLDEHEKAVAEAKQVSMAVKPVQHSDDAMELDSEAAHPVPQTPVAQIRSQRADNTCSILRQSSSITKRRKVAFISPSVDISESHNTDSDESSIELEIEANLEDAAGDASRTPLRLRHSPHIKGHQAFTITPNKQSKSPILRSLIKGKGLTATPEPIKIKEKEFKKTPNMRKAPMRTSKFFRSSPKERTQLKKREAARERLTWFDDDAIYGFGPED